MYEVRHCTALEWRGCESAAQRSRLLTSVIDVFDTYFFFDSVAGEKLYSEYGCIIIDI
jgi:hypothetical protein